MMNRQGNRQLEPRTSFFIIKAMKFPERGSGITIENLWPEVDGGRFPAKRPAGEPVTVWADIYKEGHDVIAAALLYRRTATPETAWSQTLFHSPDNDRWRAEFTPAEAGMYEYTAAAWVEVFETWRRDTERKRAAGQDIASDLREGWELARAAAARAGARAAAPAALAEALARPETVPGAGLLLADETAAWIGARAEPGTPTQLEPARRLRVDRERAGCSAWYEMFPRSQGRVPGRSATFHESEARLPEIQAMGFDVLYLPPIHPIGHSQRKGRNNSLTAQPDDPGSPYAIGAEAGGHDAIEPGLGTLADFDHFAAAAQKHGLEIALDFALNCSPDHPWVRQHPEWFFHRPDGSIKYAENPPKRYEDIYPLNFYCADWRALWQALANVLRFWMRHGVRIFRVDNPHTKPFAFWEWLIATLQAEDPGVIFLSEAFTRPKVMKYLAKAGFTQSYTYFTWRNSKAELTEYLLELTQSGAEEYFRPNFFVNTPDILPKILQTGGRPAFQTRLLLAATLGANYGMYSGFELCEGRALPNSEEYLDSEKYEYKVWDWDRPGHIKDWIARVNQLRREHAALRRLDTLRFWHCDNEQILLYSKMTADRSDALLIAVNLDPHHVQEGTIEVPLRELGRGEDARYGVRELLSGWSAEWQGRHRPIRLDPQENPAWVLEL